LTCERGRARSAGARWKQNKNKERQTSLIIP
jgi:hypothetical protein